MRDEPFWYVLSQFGKLLLIMAAAGVLTILVLCF